MSKISLSAWFAGAFLLSVVPAFFFYTAKNVAASTASECGTRYTAPSSLLCCLALASFLWRGWSGQLVGFGVARLAGEQMPNLSLNPDASPAALRAVRSAPVSSVR